MKYTQIAAALIACTLTIGFAVAQDAKQLDAEKLCEMAPRITLDNKEVNSFEVNGVLDSNGIRIRFCMVGRQPDQLAMWILDPVDGTPVIGGAGGKAMLYDPLLSEVIVIHGARPSFQFRLQEMLDQQGKPRNLNFGYGFKAAGDEKQDGSDIEIDIASILSLLLRPLELDKENGSHVLLGKTAKGSHLVALVDPDRKQGAFTRLEMYWAGNKVPFIVLDEISINKPIPDERFEFPMGQLEKSGLPMKELKGGKTIQTLLSMQRIMMVMITRLVISGDDPMGWKPKIEAMSAKPIDWNEVRENDAKHAPILKKVFGGG